MAHNMESKIVIFAVLLFAVQDSTQDVRMGKCGQKSEECDDSCWKNSYKGGYCYKNEHCTCRKDIKGGTCIFKDEGYWRSNCNNFCEGQKFNGGYCDEKQDCICRKDFEVGSCKVSTSGRYIKDCKGYCLKNKYTDGYCDHQDKNQCYCRNM